MMHRETMAPYWTLAGAISMPSIGRQFIIWRSRSVRDINQFVLVRTEITNN